VKTALILSAMDPGLGGVLVTGPKGSGKTTIVRAMEELLPKTECVVGCEFNCDPGDVNNLCHICSERQAVEGGLPVGRRRMRIVELPLSATEDGLLGAIDAEAAFRRGVKRLQPGLLGRANQNVLYIEDVNLLPDHLVDCILDPAVSGRNIVQREGLSLEHPSRFTLIASMNSEEGELRPQILDRFALKVEMDHIVDPDQRAEIARRNLSFEEDPEAFCGEFEEGQEGLRRKIEEGRGALEGVEVPEDVMMRVAVACSKLGVEGLRSDIAIVKAARALASLEGRGAVGQDDLMRVFDLAVAHRLKRRAGEPQARASIEERVREVLVEEIPLEDIGSAELSQLHAPSTDQPKAFRVKRRRLSKRLNNIVFVLVIAGLLALLSCPWRSSSKASPSASSSPTCS
jgi:Mg-chelatase subunit ChlI